MADDLTPEEDEDGTFDLAESAPAPEADPGKLGAAYDIDDRPKKPKMPEAPPAAASAPDPASEVKAPYEVPKYVDPNTASRRRDDARKKAAEQMEIQHAQEQKAKMIKFAVIGVIILIIAGWWFTRGGGEEAAPETPAGAKP